MLISKQILYVKCDGCGRKEVLHNGLLAEGAEPTRAHLPYGWRRAGKLTYCEDHKLLVIVDGGKERSF